jgi:hypothetical protein
MTKAELIKALEPFDDDKKVAFTYTNDDEFMDIDSVMVNGGIHNEVLLVADRDFDFDSICRKISNLLSQGVDYLTEEQIAALANVIVHRYR